MKAKIKATGEIINKEVRQEDIEYIFPELKESAYNDVMREMAIRAVHAPEAKSCIKSWGIEPDDVIAWLEKQAQKPDGDFKTGKIDRYKTIIHIDGKSVDDIMRLPCVKSAEKTSVQGIFRFRFYPLCMAHPSQFLEAVTEDLLCEDQEGKWHMFRNSRELV